MEKASTWHPSAKRFVENVLEDFSSIADDRKNRNIQFMRRLLNIAKKVGADLDAIRFAAYDARPGFILEIVRCYGCDPPRRPGEDFEVIQAIGEKAGTLQKERERIERRAASGDASAFFLEEDEATVRMYDLECDLYCHVMAFVDFHLMPPAFAFWGNEV